MSVQVPTLASDTNFAKFRLGGDRFKERLEQEALLQLLIETQRDHARPTAAIQSQMKANWGWSMDGVT